MGRPAETPGKPATERLTVRMSTEMRTWMGTQLGHRSEGGYIRDLIRAEAKRVRTR